MPMLDWLNFVDARRRDNLVSILQELSNLQDKNDLNFIIIGALPLLISGYLKYVVYWDVDLLFKDLNRLKEFINESKSTSLKIVNYDEDLMDSENITSFHTAWAFDKSWFNVDYILRKGLYEFYADNIQELKPYTQSLKIVNTDFSINIYLAHPWDIIVEKIFSPRTEKEMNLKIDMSVDIRHIYVVYKQDGTNQSFWHYVLKKAERFQRLAEFKEKFLNLLKIAKELGYDDIEISPLAEKYLVNA